MTKMNQFLALIPVVAFAAACSGVAPTGPSQITSSEPFEAVSGDATATGLRCSTLRSISLDIVPSSSPSPSADAYVWVEATYHFSAPELQRCPAPRWTSDRNQMVVNRTNPMRAGFLRAAGGQATLTATAANRVSNSIIVAIGPTIDLVVPGPLPQACRNIAGVDVKILGEPNMSNVVSFAASYIYKSPVIGLCTTAPAWKATRRGLTPSKTDPFRASIARAYDVRTTVTTTAPNGATGNVTF